MTPAWPQPTTLIPELLAKLPSARQVLDNYGLHGCGGPQGPVETICFFARAHDVPLERLLAELRASEIAGLATERPKADPVGRIVTQYNPEPQIADTLYRPFFKAGIVTVLTLGLTATLFATGDALTRLVATWQAPLRDIQIHGFALLIILGVSQRIFHHFYLLPQPSARLSLFVLPLLNLAVIGEVVGLVLMRLAGRAWAGLWYASAIVLAGSVFILVKNWRIFSPAEDKDRSLKFLRAAYIWLFVSLAMLVALPIYHFGVLRALAPASEAAQLGFSHAFYGATRHAITVGFVSLMIVGVAAKVVPNLNGISSKALSSLWGPFVLINLGCGLRVVGQTLTDFSPVAFPFAGISGLIEVGGLAMWGTHLWLIMAGRARLGRSSPAASADSLVNRSIRDSDSPASVLEHYPNLLATFVEHGFAALTSLQLRATVARVVTIKQACRRMNVDTETFVAQLNRKRDALDDKRRSLPLVSHRINHRFARAPLNDPIITSRLT